MRVVPLRRMVCLATHITWSGSTKNWNSGRTDQGPNKVQPCIQVSNFVPAKYIRHSLTEYWTYSIELNILNMWGLTYTGTFCLVWARGIRTARVVSVWAALDLAYFGNNHTYVHIKDSKNIGTQIHQYIYMALINNYTRRRMLLWQERIFI